MTDVALDLAEGSALIAMALGPESGVVRVQGRTVRDGLDYVVVHNDATTMSIPLGEADALLRMPVSWEQAERWLERLRDTESADDVRAWTERFAEYEAALVSSVDDEFVELLRRLYASPYASSRGELRLIWAFERMVVEEIALVLEVDAEDLVDDLHALHSANGTFAPSAPQRLDGAVRR